VLRIALWLVVISLVTLGAITLIWGPSLPYCDAGQACDSLYTYAQTVLAWWSQEADVPWHNPVAAGWDWLGDNYQSGLVFFALDVVLIVGVLPWYLRRREQSRWRTLAAQQIVLLNEAVNAALRWQLTIVEVITAIGDDHITQGKGETEEARIELATFRLRKKLNTFLDATSHATTPLSYFGEVAPSFFLAVSAFRELEALMARVNMYTVRASLERFHGDDIVPVMEKLVTLDFPAGWKWKLDPDVGRIGQLMGNDAPSWTKRGG